MGLKKADPKLTKEHAVLALIRLVHQYEGTQNPEVGRISLDEW
jgi:hypothetical protein